MGNKFEDLIAWQKTRTVQKEIILTYNILQQNWFKEQLFSAVLSVSNNFSEGYEGKSNKEFINFLNYAKALVLKSDQCYI